MELIKLKVEQEATQVEQEVIIVGPKATAAEATNTKATVAEAMAAETTAVETMNTKTTAAETMNTKARNPKFSRICLFTA